MGKKLDALLRRGFKPTKFKSMVNLAISRLAVLKNQHQARFSISRSDVIQILNLGHHERALLRVEQVIKEQNMLDVFVMIENYCHLLIERVNLLEQAKECPEELKEAISSVIYAATRCGEFPELQELRAVFASRFGKEFVARAVELRNNCGVNPKMIQKLSTRMPSMENRVRVLKEIASENNIVLQIEEVDSVATEVKMDTERKEDRDKANLLKDSKLIVHEEIEGLSNSVKTRTKYKDVADAAMAAFESAAYAAEAARAAVELSRSDSNDSSDPRNPSPPPSNVTGPPKHVEPKVQACESKDSEKIQLIQNYYSESSDNEETHAESKQAKNELEEFEQSEKQLVHNRSLSTSSLDSDHNILNETKAPFDEAAKTMTQGNDISFDESDEEITVNTSEDFSFSGSNFDGYRKNSILQSGEVLKDDVAEEIKMKANVSSEKHFPEKSETGLSTTPWPSEERSVGNAGHLSINKTPKSVRTRRTYRR